MLFKLMLKGLRTGKARFCCASAGMAIAVGALVFMTSLVATNDAQAPIAAKKACAPWSAWCIDGIQIGFGRRSPRGVSPQRKGDRPQTMKEVRHGDGATSTGLEKRPRADLVLKAMSLTIDYRPGGHVLQGPPMMALLAAAPAQNPYDAVKLTEGRWVDANSTNLEVVCVKASMRRFGAAAPELGEMLKFVGRKGTMTARIVGYLEGSKLPPQFPYVFANVPAFAALVEESSGTVSLYKTTPQGDSPLKLLTAETPGVVAAFKADEQRRMDYATPLLLIAAFLTALSLLVNSLLLSVEANRATLATLRMVGLSRSGVVGFVTWEALVEAAVGWVVGVAGAVASLAVWVACDAAAFPSGMVIAADCLALTLVVLPVLVFLAVLFALSPALRVRPMEAASRRPRARRRGMAITFACGFAAFVAVEVWGASLMRAFVPSPEWPDAIVSLLPGGVSSFDIEKLYGVPGVKRISELLPLQLFLADDKGGDDARRLPRPQEKPPWKGKPNVLFLAAEWLPDFRFIEGTREEAEREVFEEGAVIITEMMRNAHRLHKGDMLKVMVGRGPMAAQAELKVAGVVDLNWHMVTSRGLVRGLNGMPGMTDGPAFCSFDTIEALDMRPAPMVKMTHLWLEYEPAFLAAHGVFPAGRSVEAEIAKRLGNPVGATVRLHARDEIADGTLAHGSDIIGQAARVPFVFLAILAIGFVAMLVAEADARRRTFAVLRAVGATRLQLAGELVRTAFSTALCGVVAGFPVGALAGWLCSFKTGSIWPGLPHWFVVPWEVTFEGAFGALAFALVFAVPTALALIGPRARRAVVCAVALGVCFTARAAKQPAAAEKLPEVRIYVAPNGDDGKGGLSVAKPLATIQKAIAVARDLETDGPRTIVLADGEYPVVTPIRIGVQDYALTIQAAHRGKAVLQGAAKVTGWTKDAADARFLSAPLPFKPEPEQLYLLIDGDTVCDFSVYPDGGRLPYDADEKLQDFHWVRYRRDALPEAFDPASLDLASVWLVIPQEWATTRSYIEQNDVAGHGFKLKSRASMALGRFNQGFLLMNTRLGLTRPGRWMFESTAGRIVYYPKDGETSENLDCRITRARCAVEVDRVQSLMLDGLVIEGCQVPFTSPGIWSQPPLCAAVSVKCSRRVTVKDCEIRNCAGAGVMFLKAERCRVTGSNIHHVGTSAVDFQDGGVGEVEVVGNELHHAGLLSSSSPILNLQIVKAKTVGNHIHDGPGNGAVMWSGDSLFASNHIHHVMQVQRDGGGLYGAYNWTRVEGNHVHDTGGWPCLYADEGSQHSDFVGNRCEHWWPTHMHCTRFCSVSNNIFKCDGGHRFSFQGSGGGTFVENKLFLERDVRPTDYISLEACREWARNMVYTKEGKKYRKQGKRSFECGVPDRELPIVAWRVPGGVTPIAWDGKSVDKAGWPGLQDKDRLHPSQLAAGGSMCGCPNTCVSVSWDAGKLYFYFQGSYNAFCDYLGSRNLGGRKWGHWDGAKIVLPGDLEVEIYADGTAKSNDPKIDFPTQTRHASNIFRGIVYAVSIPMSALNLKGDPSGQVIPFNVCCRNEDHRISAWAYRPKGADALTGRLEFQ